MSNLRVGVLRGGPSGEYEVSLKTGANILKHLSSGKFSPVDIFVDKTGVWHLRGVQISPHKASRAVDIFVNALHGDYGEDGRVQQLLDSLGAKYTGSGASPSAIAMNKVFSKRAFESAGLRTPHHFVLSARENLEKDILEAFQSVPRPWVVKPVSGGSSLGVSIVDALDGLREAAEEAFKYSPKVMVEEMIFGKEATCGIVESFRGQKHYALIPVEIYPPDGHSFFDYDAKYSGKSRELCPGSFTKEEKREIENAAIQAHKALGLRHYSRADFIVSPRGVYILEVNSLPGLTDESLVPKSLEAAGISTPEFLEHIISLAHGR